MPDAIVCGVGAASPFADPWITVRVNGVVKLAPLIERVSPVGFEAKEMVTVFGSSRIVRESVSPPLSVAVSVSSR